MTRFDELKSAIAQQFTSIVGDRLVRYETAELLLDDGTWDEWRDLPIRLHLSSRRVLGIAWSELDELWMGSDSQLPFPIDGSTVRWRENSNAELNSIVNSSVVSVHLGKGEMSIEGKDIEIWTRLLIELDSGWLEIFNALDENGYDFHKDMPDGTFELCT